MRFRQLLEVPEPSEPLIEQLHSVLLRRVAGYVDSNPFLVLQIAVSCQKIVYLLLYLLVGREVAQLHVFEGLDMLEANMNNRRSQNQKVVCYIRCNIMKLAHVVVVSRVHQVHGGLNNDRQHFISHIKC